MPQNSDDNTIEPTVDPRACPKCLKFPCACPGGGGDDDVNTYKQPDFGRSEKLVHGLSRAELTCSWVKELSNTPSRGVCFDVRAAELEQVSQDDRVKGDAEDADDVVESSAISSLPSP